MAIARQATTNAGEMGQSHLTPTKPRRSSVESLSAGGPYARPAGRPCPRRWPSDARPHVARNGHAASPEAPLNGRRDEPASAHVPAAAANGSRASTVPVGGSSRAVTRALLRDYHERSNLRARERLIQQYMPLVKKLARQYSKRGEPYEDLVQVGSIGLIKAVDRFDLERGVDLGAFAIPNIAGEIKRYLRDRGWPIKVPRRLQELRPGLCACSAELAGQLERPATIAEIAQRSGVGEPEVAAALATEGLHSPISLSESSSAGDGDGRAELAGVVDGGYELGEQRAVLSAGLRALSARERRLLHLRFFEGMSQPQIAREVGISQIHVSRLTRRALDKLRAQIGPVEGAVPALPSGLR